MTLGGIPAKEDHKAPGKSLAGDDSRHHGKTLAKNTRRATIRPTPVKPPPPFACSCQPNQLGRHLRGNMQLLGQLSKRLCGGMEIGRAHV